MLRSSSGRSYGVIDVDSHVYEPETIWNDYLSGDGAAQARRWFSRRGSEIVFNGQAVRTGSSKLVREAIWRPGMTPEAIGRLDPQADHEMNPGAWSASDRLSDMDALGIDHAIVYPTLFLEHFPLVEHATSAAALAGAYNDWAADLAAAGAGRLHPAAVLPLQDLDASLDELSRVRELGFGSVVLRPMFHPFHHSESEGDETKEYTISANPRGIFIDHEAYRPLWAAIEESGIVAAIHASPGITNPEPTSEGSFIERVASKLAIGHPVSEAIAYLQDNAIFVVSIFFHGLLEDFPGLRLALTHGGASFVPLAIEKAETYLWVSPGSMFASENPVSLEPEEIYEDRAIIVSFDSWEASVARLADEFADKAAWGSRYPHHDAATPQEALEMLESNAVPGDLIDRFLSGNAARLFGISQAVPA